MSRKSLFFALAFLMILSIDGYLMKQSPALMPPEKKKGDVITGGVDSRYGPVEKARVRVAGDETYTLTDRKGGFELEPGPLSSSRVLVTAGKEGWFNNGKAAYPSGDAGKIFLNPVYLNDQADYRFVSPVTCAR